MFRGSNSERQTLHFRLRAPFGGFGSFDIETARIGEVRFRGVFCFRVIVPLPEICSTQRGDVSSARHISDTPYSW